MPSYSTIEEKAVQWNISTRHVQLLCRTGKIEGAVKRAGAWAIPDDAPTPAKNTKSSDKGFKYVGTKNKIFNSAIELSVLKGFSNVSFKDLADSVGVRQSTVYSHFKTKQDILDAIYDFFCYYYNKDRPSMEDMEAILQSKSLMEIVKAISYEFKDEYRQRMSDITRIVFLRIGVDERAREIVRSQVIDEGIRYVEDILCKAIEIGRFAPFDTHTMAVFINSIRIFKLYIWILDLPHEDMMKFMKDEQKLYEYAASFIEDLKPSGEKNEMSKAY